MNPKTLFLSLCLCCSLAGAQAQEAAGSLVYIGTRGQPSADGPRQGIYAARLDSQTGRLESLGLQVELERAIWLAGHPTLPMLYTLAKIEGDPDDGDSSILGYAIDAKTGTLRLVTAGVLDVRLATQFDLDTATKTIFTAAMDSGNIATSPLYDNGNLGDAVSWQSHSGTGPHRRQASPRAHGIALDPSGRYVVSPGFGSDKIYVHHFDPQTRQLSPADPPFVTAPAGSAPRHVVFHPNGRFVYVNTELAADIRIYRWDAAAGSMGLVGVTDPWPKSGSSGEKSTAEIAMSADGRFFYIELRGDQDSIVAYAVNADDGSLREIQRIGSQGTRPWSFGIDPTGRWLLVANSDSHTVDVLGIDQATGKLNATGNSIPVPFAAAIGFYSE